jgi:hypothetical protein
VSLRSLLHLPPMKKALAVLLTVLSLPALARAGGVEIAGFAGYTFPFYSQTFTYDPGPIEVPIPGVSLTQNGIFELKGSGGLAFAGSLTVFASDTFGFELRLDGADVTVDTKTASYTVRADLPPPLDPVFADLSLAKGTADVQGMKPFSLNVKLQTPGNVRLYVSGGASHLGTLDLTLTQTVALGVTAVNLETGNLEVATIGLKGTTPTEGQSSWGGNLGLGLRIPIGERGALVLEGRGFYFPKRTIEWEPVIENALSPLEEELLSRVLDRLDPVEFEPWWVQASVGLAIRF